MFETRFDADESLKKADHKIKALQDNALKSQHKIAKYEMQKARLFNAKRGAELLDRDWAEVCTVFALRLGEVQARDKKFESKGKKVLSEFVHVFRQAIQRPLKEKQMARRHFSQSTKDHQ